MEVPIAAPRVPSAGTGPYPRNQHDVQRDVEHGQRHAEPQRGAGIAGGAQRSAQHEEHQHADAVHEHRPQKREGLGADLRRGMHEFEQIGRQQIAYGRHDAESQNDGCEARLINRAVDLVRLVRAGEARHQHAHPGEDRADEHDDNEKDLPAHSYGCVGGIADVVADHRVVDDPLQTSNRVLENGWPRDLPDCMRYRALDDGSVEVTGRPADKRNGRRGGSRFSRGRRGDGEISRQERRS